MAMSQAKKEANKKWNDANLKEKYDRIQVVVPKGKKEVIQATAKTQGAKSVNSFICDAIDKAMTGAYSGFQSENGDSGVLSRSISHTALFSESELASITAKLQDGQTVEEFIKAAVLEKLAQA